MSEVLPTGLDPRDEPRSIERRSKLVISIQEDARVILQMPRGNLESIHPRVILLDLLKQLLSNKQFGIAFNMMKRHRINLNLLVDHEFKNFTENVETLISQIGSDVQDICLFLSELSSEQITRSMYKYAYLEECSSSNKLALVCSEMRKVMTQMDPERYFIPILVTFVKDDPPQIGQALKMIFDKGTGKVQDEALRYLNYLIDIEKLYKEALGTYDFDIFLMVAAKSNKDPKEYHAYLNKLRAYENPYYRQFKIDVDLKRNEKALVNMNSLTSDDHRDECLNFIKNNKLFWSAVKIISPTHPWIQSIWEMFADYLLIKRYYEEAGIAYQKAKSITNAIKAYQLSENWQIAIELAFSLEDYDCISLCRLFVTRLLTDNKHLDAAYIQENYLKDKHAAIYTLIKGHHWGEANRLLGMEPSGTKIYNVIKSTLEDELAREAFIFLSVVSEKRSELEAKIDRLKFVEETKQKTLENEDNLVDDEHDLFSDTSSISDSSSVSSNSRSAKSKGDVISLATRKTRHKNKKHLKKYSLKEGSANEDFALRKLIKEMIESCIALTEEAKSLIRWLFFYDKCEDASWCQTDLSALLDFIETQVKIIWPDPEESIQSLDQTPINKIKRAQSLASRCLKDPESFVPPKLTCKPWKLALLQD
ncbi:putative elongator complex protein 1 [Panonychus citri]|uniref:putative elongator complex protein 1 n=1 Tax=Panonychus citri TaxID=50023 RepID=UPI0023072575|nr:putative elongator complex protein 1 [Panonychus citri]